MTFFSNFLNKVETDFANIEGLFQKFFPKSISWAQVAAADIAYVAPVLETFLALDSQVALSNDVKSVVASIQTDLVVAVKFIKALDNSKNLTDVLEAIKANLASLLQLAAVKNSSHLGTITAYVNGIIAEIEAVISAVTNSAATPTA